MVIEAFAGNVLFLEQTVDSNMKVFSIEQLLVINESIQKNLNPQWLHSTLYFTQQVIVNQTSLFSVEDTLSFNESLEPKVIVEIVEQILVIAQDAKHNALLATNQFEISEEVEVDYCKAAFDTFEPIDIASCTLYAAPEIAQTLAMISTATAYIPKKCWINGPFTVEAP